ncbi:dihydropteroate synthase [Bacteroides caecigallinarum]|uniref:dihydropteroate synthase n=1 Tax=Bacteroides caecigallinarum TaxID=1411144 RepID=UPI001F2D3779|nr:dihydropteroate synthase [Bacteroides caecigallinarum]MCF2592247.1 dihydropteroate synthase [Bacteroides caecigallinarum]
MENKIARYINVNGNLMDLTRPKVMGILNVTPDSFYAGSRKQSEEDILLRAREIIDEGGDIIDIGAYSSRPDAENISTEEEMSRLKNALTLLNREIPEAVISVDTFRADIAKMCVEEHGVAIINDISAGCMDDNMMPTAAKLGVPYIMTHMKGTPQDMQKNPEYENVVKEVIYYFSEKVQKMRDLGGKDIIIDPGFGFGKTLEHNYMLMNKLEELQIFELPVLVGISRKSMIYKLLDNSPEDALNGTTALNTISLMKGANILRVHDVKEACEAVKIYCKLVVGC